MKSQDEESFRRSKGFWGESIDFEEGLGTRREDASSISIITETLRPAQYDGISQYYFLVTNKNSAKDHTILQPRKPAYKDPRELLLHSNSRYLPNKKVKFPLPPLTSRFQNVKHPPTSTSLKSAEA